MLDWFKRIATPVSHKEPVENENKTLRMAEKVGRLVDRLGANRVAAAPQATALDPPVIRITAEKAVQHLYDNLRDQLRAKDHQRANESFEELLHSGWRLSEIIAELQRGPATSNTSKPGCFGYPRSADACEAAPEPPPEPTLTSTSERALQSTIQSVPLSTPESMIESAGWSIADLVAQKSGDSAAGRIPPESATIISQTPVFSGESMHQHYGAIRWFARASRTRAALLCIAFCGTAFSVAISGEFFLHVTSQTDTAFGAAYVSISSNTWAAGDAGAGPQAAVAAASASQIEPLGSAPIPSLATDSNSSSDAPIPWATSAAVAAAEATQPQSTSPDALPEAAPTPVPAAPPEEAMPIVTAAPDAFAAGTAPVVPRPVEAARPEAQSAAIAGISALLARGDSLFGTGDVISARLFYERATNAGDAQAALKLGGTYDPFFLAWARLNGVRGDLAVATRWYQRARDLGASEAEILLKSIANK